MAISYVGAGAIAVDTTGAAQTTPAPPTHEADDILIAVAFNRSAGTMSTATSGWTQIAQIAVNASCAWFWKRAAAAGTAGPDITAAVTDQFAICYAFRGCVTTGDPFEDATTVEGLNGGVTSSTTPQSALITTTSTNRLAVCLSMHDDDTAYSSGNPPSGWDLNSELTSATGTQVGFNVISKTVAAAGDVAAVTVGTLAASELWGTMTLALIPAPTTAIKTVNGLAIASVKTVNGLAIASVKTINGLA